MCGPFFEVTGVPGACEHVRMLMQSDDPVGYTGSDEVIQSDAPQIAAVAANIRAQYPDDVDFVKAAFEWVRDRIDHSMDARDPRVTISATDVLAHGVGLCFAKSHLLTALLRNEHVPAGLCYQRLRAGETFIVHGLSVAYVEGAWHRLDPRGNKEGVDAQFRVGYDQVAWRTDPGAGEVDYRWVYRRPAREVLDALHTADDALDLCASGLPSEILAPVHGE